MAECLTAMGLQVEEVPSELDNLIEAAQTGRREAMEALLCAIERKVLIFAWRLTGDTSAAEDIAQETFLTVCRRIGSYRTRTNFWGWVYSIALNKSRDHFRTERRFDSLDAVRASHEPDNERAEQLRRVVDAMRVLTDRERAAFVLMDVEGFSSAEAARIMGCLQLTARSRASHARKKIRAELSRHYPELGS